MRASRIPVCAARRRAASDDLVLTWVAVGCTAVPRSDQDTQPTRRTGLRSRGRSQRADRRRSAPTGGSCSSTARRSTGWRGSGSRHVPRRTGRSRTARSEHVERAAVPCRPTASRSPACDLMSDRQLRRFRARVGMEDRRGGNSGVKYNVSEALSMAMRPTTPRWAASIRCSTTD